MTKKAIIYDLDNTIYSVHSIGENLFGALFTLIQESGIDPQRMIVVKDDIMRKPFQVVAATHQLGDALTQKGIDLLNNLTYEGPIEPFSDYNLIRQLPVDRFLVTTGFLKLQQSKIRQMGIEQDFKEIHIVDPAASRLTKKDVFEAIMQKYNYKKEELLVVGDDPHSEIKAAQELGIDRVLYDKYNSHPENTDLHRIADFKELSRFI